MHQDDLFLDLFAAADPIPEVAARHALSLDELLDFAEHPDTRRRYDRLLRLADDRFALAIAQSRTAAATTLTGFAADTDSGEPARKSAAVLFRAAASKARKTEPADSLSTSTISAPAESPTAPLSLAPVDPISEGAPQPGSGGAFDPIPDTPPSLPPDVFPLGVPDPPTTLPAVGTQGGTRMTRIAPALALALAAGAAVAQPANDACSSAEAIAGFTTVSFDNSAATTDGLPNALCNFAGQQGIDRDVWYCWTASQSGPVRARTCTLAGFDTKIAVYDGCTCPEGSAILACSDDNCALQTIVSWNAQAGRTYLIRIGSYPGAAGGAGQFAVESAIIAGPIVNPASNNTYFLLSPTTWTAGEAAAVAMGGHLTTIRSAAENEFIRAQVLGFDGVDRRGWIGLHDPDGTNTWVWVGGEPLGYTNWNGGEPNNIGTERWTELFYSNGAWNNNTNNPPFSEYPIVEITGSNCYPDCNGDRSLNVNDFLCFLSAFAAQNLSQADCDRNSTLNVNDFVCFQGAYAAGCSTL